MSKEETAPVGQLSGELVLSSVLAVRAGTRTQQAEQAETLSCFHRKSCSTFRRIRNDLVIFEKLKFKKNAPELAVGHSIPLLLFFCLLKSVTYQCDMTGLP